MDLISYCDKLAHRSHSASRDLARASTAQKNRWLLAAGDGLVHRAKDILAANAKDVALAEATHLPAAQLDRLRLDESRVIGIAKGLLEIASLSDPVGRVLDERTRPNGLKIQKVAVPLGVILFIYESRPNVTVDAAGLCVKSGNAVILRGGKESLHTNQALYAVLRDSLEGV